MNFTYYIKWAFKQIKNFPVQSLINILGLSIGLTVFALITLFVWHQKQMDGFHDDINNIYRFEDGFGGITPATYKNFYQSQLPEIKRACRIGTTNSLLQYQPEGMSDVKQGFYTRILLADSSFFSIFSYPLIMGNPSESFTDPNVAIISESTAEKLFGDEDPMNKVISFKGTHSLTVKGVMKDFPVYSSLDYEVVIPFQFYQKWFGDPDHETHWFRYMYETFFQFHEDVNRDDVKLKMDSLLIDMYVAKYNYPREEFKSNQFLRPYKDIYLTELGDKHKHGKSSHIIIFSVIAFFVLLIACINYINISTAVATKRSKTLGIKKINGASRRKLITLILSESIFISFVSVVISVLLIEFCLSYFVTLIDMELVVPYSFGLIVVVFVGVPLILGITAGLYPSYYITNFNTLNVIKGEVNQGRKGASFRRVLTITQFSISVFLIIGTLTVKKQLGYISQFEPGYETDQVLYSNLNPIIKKHFDVLKVKMLENPNVLDITRSNQRISKAETVSTMRDGDEKDLTIPFFSVDENFFNFFGVDIIWGENFSSDDLAKENAPFIINKKMAEWYGGIDTVHSKKIWDREIIGVSEDFQTSTLHEELEEIVVELDPDQAFYMYYKINANNYQETLKYIGDAWDEIAPEFPFEYKFLDNDFEQLYKSEIQFGKVFMIFAGISIFIACLGLFALASFVSLQRTKEIGIRKAIGATTPSVVGLLSREFGLWVLISNLIAAPVAWFYLEKWLNSFAYKTPFSIWIFLLAAIISLFIALSTILYHTISTARKNPVDSLRYE